MALQLTPMMGTTAFPDRMGDYYPEDLKAGRIVQGHPCSGAMGLNTVAAVDCDLADAQWRTIFQESMQKDPRFQRGLFSNPMEGRASSPEPPQKPEWEHYGDEDWATTLFDVAAVQVLSRQRIYCEELIRFEYGWALIKTAASLTYTIQLWSPGKSRCSNGLLGPLPPTCTNLRTGGSQSSESLRETGRVLDSKAFSSLNHNTRSYRWHEMGQKHASSITLSR